MKRFMVIAAIAALSLTGCGGSEDPVHVHDFSGGWKSDAAQHWHECPEDGEKADLADHTVETWTQTKAPSILEDGVESGTCTVCGAAVTRVIAMTSMIEAVQINAGTFTMGSPADEPGRRTDETQHQVTLTKGFYMGVYPVTQKQYEEVTGIFASSIYGRGDGNPIYYVSWYEALVFCNKLSVMEGLTPAYRISTSTDPEDWGEVPTTTNGIWNTVTIVAGSNGWRLPTEAQWEYACRAGTETAFNWDTDTIDGSKANYMASYVDANNTTAGTAPDKTTVVGSYAPNAWGLYDMHGNVFEWCWDWYDANYGAAAAGDAQTDPDGAVTGANRVRRGGSWSGDGRDARSAYRGINPPSNRFRDFGFRLVRP